MLWAWVIHSEPCHLVPGYWFRDLVETPHNPVWPPTCLVFFLWTELCEGGGGGVSAGVGLAWFSQLTGLAWGVRDAGGADVLAQTISRAMETTGKVEQKQPNA